MMAGQPPEIPLYISVSPLNPSWTTVNLTIEPWSSISNLIFEIGAVTSWAICSSVQPKRCLCTSW